jgi:hypothetical protein
MAMVMVVWPWWVMVLYMYMYVGVWFVFKVILIFCNLFAFGVLKEGFNDGLAMVGDGGNGCLAMVCVGRGSDGSILSYFLLKNYFDVSLLVSIFLKFCFN